MSISQYIPLLQVFLNFAAAFIYLLIGRDSVKFVYFIAAALITIAVAFPHLVRFKVPF